MKVYETLDSTWLVEHIQDESRFITVGNLLEFGLAINAAHLILFTSSQIFICYSAVGLLVAYRRHLWISEFSVNIAFILNIESTFLFQKHHT